VSISPAFLDELRARTSLSALISKTVKLRKAGRDHDGLCPFHAEKSPSFTVSDDKGFYHCFGCGAHGDAVRWLVDRQGLGFIDAVAELAGAAGMEMPPRDARATGREDIAARLMPLLDTAARWYAQQLEQAGAMRDYLAGRDIGDDMVAAFGLGYAPGGRASVKEAFQGVEARDLADAGIVRGANDDKAGQDWFRQRLMIPVRDARGRVVGFAGRATGDTKPKYMNSTDGPVFDKGRLLFNLDRAAPAARERRRLIVVEGQFDAIGLAAVGIDEVVAPMGTAITEHQIERMWRVHHCPVLLLDGDAAGRKAALRVCERAVPMIGPGRSFAVATIAEGQDPDTLRIAGGRAAVDEAIARAEPLSVFLWAAAAAVADMATPEGRAALWLHLAGLAGTIADAETRSQYLSDWRARFDAVAPPAPATAEDEEILPDGRLAGATDVERARVRLIGSAWWQAQAETPPTTPERLTRLAWSAGRRARGGLLDRDSALDAMSAMADAIAGVTGADVVTSFEAGERRGFDAWPLVEALRYALHPLTDLGNAERFRDRFGAQFRFTTAKGWLAWDERRWKVLDQEKDVTPAEVQAAVFATIRAIQDEARAVRDTGVADEDGNPDGADHLIVKGKVFDLFSAIIAKWGRSSESAGKLSCIANLAKRWVTVPIEDFDTDPFALNVTNGTLRFKRQRTENGTWQVRVDLCSHVRGDLNTKLAPVEYSPEAESPLYDDMLAWAQPDAAMRRYLHQWGGYSSSGHVGEQKLQFWYGLGANGKSTVIDAWAHVLGDYAGTIGIETFLDQGIKKRGDAATPDLARLGGVRLLRASEPERGAKLNEALIKAVTGGEPLAVRALNKGFFDLRPAFKLTCSFNDKPAIPGTDEGIWRRVKLVPWEQHRAKAERDEELPEKLKREASGIFGHLVAGLLDWMEHGFAEPSKVVEATADYRDDSDPLARFLRLCTEAGGVNDHVQSSKLHSVFCAWAKAAGEKEWTQVGFSKAMKAKGHTNKASNGMQWLGLKLVRTVGDFIDGEGRVVLDPGGSSGGFGSDNPHAPDNGGLDDDDILP